MKKKKKESDKSVELSLLLEAGNFTEVVALIKSAFAKNLSDEERGRAYFTFLRAYLAAVNVINRRYLTALQEVIRIAQELNATERRVEDAARLATVRSKLG